ncbi:MAG: metallophosphatase family protein [Lachnospiraceae bacterium]|nr:metallophosphatase family protein [Lachnospiraceae bacterium]
MKIAVISDTHSLLRDEVREVLKDCDCILHGGDIASRETYESIRAIQKAYFVRGNADEAWAMDIPKEIEFELEGYRFYMIHNIKQARKDLSGIDFVVYGHSHKYEERKDGHITYLNPGSCGPRRFTQPVTVMVLNIAKDRSLSIERIDLSPVLKRGNKYPPQKEMDKLIENIVRDMDMGKTVDQISIRNRVEKDLVEEILQIYTTHPGIDTYGILNRIRE